MKLLKKPVIAIILAVLMIAVGIYVGTRGTSAINTSYYAGWISDEAKLLSPETKEKLNTINEKLNRTYGSIIGYISVPSLDGEQIDDYIYQRAEKDGYGSMDIVVLVSVAERDWYLAYGEAMAGYSDNDLRIAAVEAMTDSVYGEGADRQIQKLYSSLSRWYEKHVPIQGNNPYLNSGQDSGRRSSAGGFIRAILAVIVLIALLRFLFVPLLRFPRYGTWMPLWGWSFFPLFHIRRHYGPGFHREPPPGAHEQRPPHFGGGFGAGGRGFGGGFGRGGGFGGGSRGGFGGGGGFGGHNR